MNQQQKPVDEVIQELIGQADKALADARSHGLSEASDIAQGVGTRLRELLSDWKDLPIGLQSQYEERYRQQIHSQRNLIGDAQAYIGNCND
jgi:hypothetical protein